MITVEATVVSLGPDQVWVQAAPTDCSTCGGANGCGIRLFSTACIVRAPARVPTSITVHVGDRVLIGMPDGALWQSTVLIYLVPLLCFFSAGIAAQGCWGHIAQWPIVLSGLVGLGLGFLLAHHCASHFQYTPVICERL